MARYRKPVWASPVQQFNSKYTRTAGCWLWHSTTRASRKDDPKSTYGVMKVGGREGKLVLAHRFSYEHFNGPIPEGMQIRHTCDTPLCVNPNHLLVGTNEDNVSDKVSRGRAAKKLTEEQVAAIRADDRSHRKIGKDYGVSGTMVGYIKRGDFWNGPRL